MCDLCNEGECHVQFEWILPSQHLATIHIHCLECVEIYGNSKSNDEIDILLSNANQQMDWSVMRCDAWCDETKYSEKTRGNRYDLIRQKCHRRKFSDSRHLRTLDSPHKEPSIERFIYLFYWCDLSKSISTFHLRYDIFGCAHVRVCVCVLTRLSIAEHAYMCCVVPIDCHSRVYNACVCVKVYFIDCSCNLITFNNK